MLDENSLEDLAEKWDPNKSVGSGKKLTISTLKCFTLLFFKEKKEGVSF
jgi:hypothetical protein